MTHTPGPWKAESWSMSDRSAYGYDIVSRQGVLGRITIRDLPHSTIRRQPGQEGQSNARLMAAAPELLEALKELCQGTWVGTLNTTPGYRDRVTRASEVIAKAEGK